MMLMMHTMMVAMIMIVNDHGANAPEIETRYATTGAKAARRDGREHTTKQSVPEGLKPKLRQSSHSTETSRPSKDSPDALARHAATTTIRRKARRPYGVTTT